jgi:beta-N-acetylhexosaminidase
MRSTSPWVTKTLASLSLDEKLGQLLHPNMRPQWTEEQIRAALPPVRLGGIFLFSGSGSDFARVTRFLQAGPGIPLVVSSDLESGAGRMISTATSFPDLMSLAAADSEELARAMGEATAVEARAYGMHWTFGPVVDVNAHPGNPIANTRSLGDDPAKIARLATALIESLQSHGLAATVKHFPGDGWDDRDQHLATSINPLSVEEWERTSGVPFRQAFTAGCWTTMIGHIAMPSLDAGDPNDLLGPPPAIQSKAITTDFLRGQLGFDGLVVSDAIEMNGSVSRVATAYELVVNLINAGNDMLLFCDAKRDFAHLQKAVASGDISLERIDEACARVLELKERLGFADPASALPAADPEAALAPTRARFAEASRTLAERALTLVRSEGPFSLKRGDKVLALHLRSNPEYNVDAFDELLKARGLEVVHRTEADTPYEYRSIDYADYAMVLVLWTVGPTWGTSFIRPAGPWMRGPWFVRHEYPACPVVHVSFGSPYLIHDVPWAGTLLNAYSPDPSTQAAVAEWLFGELKPTGTSPVDLDRHAKVRELIRKEFAKG